MSDGNDRDGAAHPRDVGVLRSAGSGVGRPEDEVGSVSTTETNSGLAAGDSSGRPQHTPERKAVDAARGEEPQIKGGPDTDLRPRDDEQVHATDDIHVTPPHGDKLQNP